MVLFNVGRGMFAKVDESDLPLLVQYRWNYRRGDRTYYAITDIKGPGGKGRSMHSLLMNTPEGLTVDHIDGNGLNNQRTNLRLATMRQQCMNRVAMLGKTNCGFKGIARYGNALKWWASICDNGVRYVIGWYATPELAARAYDREALRRFGEFAKLNFPEDHGLSTPPARRFKEIEQLTQ